MSRSARTEYACIAMLELALAYPTGGLVRLREVAEPHGIPEPFLAQILQQLKAAGLVGSVRGAAGGYRLVREPSQITVGEVVAALEGPGETAAADAGLHRGRVSTAARTLRHLWRRLALAEQQILDAVTFGDLAEQASDEAAPMYYI